MDKERIDPDTKLPMLDDDGNPITEEKEVTIPMFKVVSVFDISQTEGKPLPQISFRLSGDVAQYEVFMDTLRRTSQVPIEMEPMRPGMDGYFGNAAAVQRPGVRADRAGHNRVYAVSR